MRVLIVGGGAAGCVLAARLSEEPGVQVRLFEAGPDYPVAGALPPELRDGHSMWRAAGGVHDWNYAAFADAAQTRTIRIPRGKVVGGSSAVNGSIFMRGMPEDYLRWAALGNPGWDFDSLLRYFVRVETDRDFGAYSPVHGRHGPVPVQRFTRDTWRPLARAFHAAAIARGYPEDLDQNGINSRGVAARCFSLCDGERMSAQRTYLAAARARPNLRVVAGADVCRVVFDGARAVGIVVNDAEGERTEYGDGVVLCAGVFGTPALLQRSGVGAPEHVRTLGAELVAELPGVGRGLIDHPAVFLTGTLREAVSSGPFIQVGLRCASEPGRLNDLQISPLYMEHGHAPAGVSIPKQHAGMGLIVALQDAESCGTVHATPEGDLRISYNYLTEPEDLRRLRMGVRKAIELLNTPPLSELVLQRLEPTQDDLFDDDSLDRWLRTRVYTQHHSAGTCRMGPAADHGSVVGADCRVHRTERLWVVDASIIPVNIRANICATVMAAAELAADCLRDTLRTARAPHGSRPVSQA